MNKHYSEYETNMAAVFVWGRDFLFIRRKGPFVRIGYGNLRAAMYPLIQKCYLSFSVIYSCFFRTQDFDMDSFNG